MKSPSNATSLGILFPFAALALSIQAHATDISTVPLSTYYAPSSVDVKPNILFVLDDSGSMDWSFMPDQADWYDWSNRTGSYVPGTYQPANYADPTGTGEVPVYLIRNSDFNGLAYNPAIRYLPPIKYNANNTQDTTTYPSMTGVSQATGGDSSASAASPNWKQVKYDGYGVQSTSTTNLSGGVFSYVTLPGEYCAKPDLRTCVTQGSASDAYPYAARMRWCSTADLTTCRATHDNSNNRYPRLPAPRIATITFSGTSSTNVTQITVNGLNLMSGATTGGYTSPQTLAAAVVTKINACTTAPTGNCTTVGYFATYSGGELTLYAPDANTATPVVTKSGSMTATPTAFTRTNVPLPYWRNTSVTPNSSSSTIPGENIRYTITPSINSYAYPGSNEKAAGRTDCAASTCTYREEMTNYANWHAYYRTRMQMMKTASSRSFATIDTAADIASGASRYRIGYMSINNEAEEQFLNLNEFTGAQRANWFTKLFAAAPGSGTPLRQALANAGRIYGGKLNGQTFYGVTVTDPIQWSCQQNFTVLSTDGYWNGAAGFKLDGSTAVGNQDASMPAPYNDGGSAQVQERTSSLQARTQTQTAEKGTLQISTSQLQASTSQLTASTSQLQAATSSLQSSTLKLYRETSSNSGNTWSTKTEVTSCTWDTSGPTRTRCSYDSAGWSTPSSASSCTPRSAGTNSANGQTWNTGVACSYTAWTTPTTVSSCAPASQSSGTSTWNTATARQCSYTSWTTPVTVSSCTPISQSSGTGTWAAATARQCGYTGWSAASSVSSCTPRPQSSGTSTWTVDTATTCSYSAWTAATATTSCTPRPQSSGTGTWNVDTAATCSYQFASAAATPTCSPTYVSGNYTNPVVYRNCATSYSTWSNVPSCTATTDWSASGTRTACQYSAWSSWSNISNCTAAAQSTGPDYTVGTARQCQTAVSGGYSDTLADVAAYYYNTDLRRPSTDAVASTDVTGTCVGPVISPKTTPNDLCKNDVPSNDRDVAAWQHMTTFTLGLGATGKMLFSPTYWTDNWGDFYSVKTRATANPSEGICVWGSSGNTCVWPQPGDTVPANIDDLWHASVNGRGTYFSAKDPASLAQGLEDTLRAITQTPRPGTAAAAASSNPNISAGDNYIFSSYYKSVDWYGDLYRQRFDTVAKTVTPHLDWSARAMLDCATTPWAASHAYVAGNFYRYGTACLMVTADYVSGATFGTADQAKTALVADSFAQCSNNWAANHDYSVGNIYSQNGTCYYVIKAYKSGSEYGSSDKDSTNAAYVSGSPTTRTIYTKGSSGLVSFEWANLTDPQKAYFTKPYIAYDYSVNPPTGLSQFCSPAGGSCLSSTAQNNTTVAASGAAGEALVNYLRGDRTNESTYFRERKHVLGDIVSSEARYVQAPLFSYTDTNYSAFKTAMKNRKGAVYVASNDGMLHAFDAETGKEIWAYIPEFVLPNIYKLADLNYKENHQFFVDGTPETGEICPNAPSSVCTAAQWKTILVGGLNRGGKGFYALDVTNPTNPKLLWEFTDANMGFSFGNPRITKLKSGKWVVLLTSGYNNADGLGHLYVLDANTGALIRDIVTTAGSAATPSGLARIAAHAPDAETNNTTLAAYGGDTLGNLWRFDINGDLGAAGYDAQRLVTFVDSDNAPQPITAKPVVTTINGKPVIYAGTGRYLGISDLSDTQSQTMYAVKDTYGASSYPSPRTSSSGFVKQTLVSGTCTNEGSCIPGEAIRKINSTSPVNWASNNGWYVDFITEGERANTDPTLALGTLVFTTNTPNNASIEPCGEEPTSDNSSSWMYSLNYATGGAVDGAGNVVAVSLGNVIATRPVLIRTADGSIYALIRTSGIGSTSSSAGDTTEGYFPGAKEDSGMKIRQPPVNPTSSTTRRVSWREITVE